MDVLYFDNFPDHKDKVISSSLLWEYDLSRFDFQKFRNIVVQRVVERGWRSDWYAALNLYGVEGMRTSIKELPYLNDKDMHFVSLIFDIPFSEMKCYIKKQSQPAHWNS